MAKYYFLLCVGVLLITKQANAQTPNVVVPNSYPLYQKLNKAVYSTDTRFHSSVRSYFADDSLLRDTYDSIMNVGVDTVRYNNWITRKLFNKHLLDVQDPEYTIYIDYLPDLQIGREFNQSQTTWINTRGYQVGGTVGKKFSFYTSGFENQGRFPNYLTDYINNRRVVPGQAIERNLENGGSTGLTKDWSYATAIASYTPAKYLNIVLGYDKNFIGDGYRSMLLSDVSAPTTFLRLNANLGNVSYMMMWSYMRDIFQPRLSYDNGYRKKWGVFHYLDWNVTDRLSLGFFDAIIWQDADETGRRGFDFSYVNPIIFLRTVEFDNGSPDNATIGLNTKYEVLKNTTVYGQFMLDEFVAKEFFSNIGSYRNKWGAQIGVRGSDLLSVPRLNYLLEFNTAKPYTYSSRSSITSYSQTNEALAHPFGANFRELTGILNYSYKRFDFYGQAMFSQYGLDAPGANYGKDFNKDYRQAVSPVGNYITQGYKTDLYYANGRVAYVINPKYNLRLEIGGTLRRESNVLGKTNTAQFTFGLRSSFRNFYNDF